MANKSNLTPENMAAHAAAMTIIKKALEKSGLKTKRIHPAPPGARHLAR